MDSRPAVSVVISTRNRAGYLPACLRSLATQHLDEPFEVVVVDNAATDQTADVLREWCAADPRFRTAREERLGVSAGKNRGIREARGDLLVFTDDDIIADPNWLTSYVERLREIDSEAVIVGGPIEPIPDDLGPFPGWFTRNALHDIGLLDYEDDGPITPAWQYVWGANMAVPRRLFESVGLWDETLGPRGDDRRGFEDTELQDRVRRADGMVWFCREARVRHRVDRRVITPRRVTSQAFARGRNSLWAEIAVAGGDVNDPPQRALLRASIRLVRVVTWWFFSTIVFRFRSSSGTFERARRAAFAAGHASEVLAAGRSSEFLARVLRRLAFAARGLITRLTSDSPSPSRVGASGFEPPTSTV